MDQAPPRPECPGCQLSLALPIATALHFPGRISSDDEGGMIEVKKLRPMFFGEVSGVDLRRTTVTNLAPTLDRALST
jgi:hypothetical protein